ncbi:uncharacterized protein C18orf19 homolog A-like [Paramacrobiotus metropolitanus]|uniref:uncharacterized protein C18orf19 homolog A-like n=1 Tax=Paramacrobiotus metropolitanus TaxID=2943436 RepID=UPI00244659D0|nr:uncharacterized protein C18orf19 homolog A-like [Paramacrobiotus metropolitanus]XP_055337000.1 uncharacterized protein C18orf19 homolog A-like [Paramacrobiotus metropolitanus]
MFPRRAAHWPSCWLGRGAAVSIRTLILRTPVRQLRALGRGLVGAEWRVSYRVHDAARGLSSHPAPVGGRPSTRGGPNGAPGEGAIRAAPPPARADAMAPAPEKPKPSYWQRFKEMYKSYWYVLLPVFALTSAGWMLLLYYLVKSGVDIVSLLERVGASEALLERFRLESSRSATYAYLASAYALYHVVAPLRYGLTLALTTLAIAYLRRWGYIRPVPSKERLQQMVSQAPTHVRRMVRRRLDARHKRHTEHCDPDNPPKKQ